MKDEIKKLLGKDPDGLLTYEYLANHISEIDDVIDDIVENMIMVDHSGQFLVSAARYLFAIDKERYKEPISHIIASAIEKDRERRYIGDLLTMWGNDYDEHAAEYSKTDDNFRRIYKRLYATGI